jgi:uncharacterized protein
MKKMFNKSKKRIWFGLLIVLCVALFLAVGVKQNNWFNQDNLTSPSASSWTQLTQSKYDRQRLAFDINGNSYQLEIVNQPASITQGLSGRTEIGSDGMLFIFAKPGTYRFWMKEMRFNLDLVWLRSGKIVDIMADLPAPSVEVGADPAQLAKIPTYSSTTEADAVLEIPAGMAQKWGLKVGDSLVPQAFD